jgi:LEA14-like dessication related protein
MRYLIPLMFLFLGACETIQQLKDMKEPKVELENVDIKDAGIASATLVFALKVDNPNPFELKVDGLDYQVDVSGSPLTSGVVNNPLAVGAKTASVIALPITVKYSDLFDSVTALLTNKQAPYRIKGAARIGVLSIPFEESGELAFKNGKLEQVR